MSSKNQIANRKFGDDFECLSAGEKAAVTREYNAQGTSAPARTSGAGVKATIGRVGVNGTSTCILNAGATVADLLSQGKISLDTKKEKVIDVDTGNDVSLSTKVKHNGTYAVAVEIKSAC